MKKLILITCSLFYSLLLFSQEKIEFQVKEKIDTIRVIMLISDTTTNNILGKKEIVNSSNVQMIFGYKAQYSEKAWMYTYLKDDKKPLDKKYIIWQVKYIRD